MTNLAWLLSFLHSAEAESFLSFPRPRRWRLLCHSAKMLAACLLSHSSVLWSLLSSDLCMDGSLSVKFLSLPQRCLTWHSAPRSLLDTPHSITPNQYSVDILVLIFLLINLFMIYLFPSRYCLENNFFHGNCISYCGLGWPGIHSLCSPS